MNRNLLEVTSSHGHIVSFDYLNALRAIFEKQLMSIADYDAAVDQAMKLGRDAVIQMHRDALLPFIANASQSGICGLNPRMLMIDEVAPAGPTSKPIGNFLLAPSGISLWLSRTVPKPRSFDSCE